MSSCSNHHLSYTYKLLTKKDFQEKLNWGLICVLMRFSITSLCKDGTLWYHALLYSNLLPCVLCCCLIAASLADRAPTRRMWRGEDEWSTISYHWLFVSLHAHWRTIPALCVCLCLLLIYHSLSDSVPCLWREAYYGLCLQYIVCVYKLDWRCIMLPYLHQ